jgi:hypothetical protein
MHDFKEGDRVEWVDPSRRELLGCRATITRVEDGYVDVDWDVPVNTHYTGWYVSRFGLLEENPKVYLAGPMTGIPEFNFPLFKEAAELLRTWGYDVFSPGENDLANGFDPTGFTGDEKLADHGFSLRDALGADLEFIAKHATAVYVLPGYEQSRGVAAELALARALDIPIRLLNVEGGYCTDLTLTPSGKRVVFDDDTDGEVRTTSATGGQKGSKPARYDLIPAEPLRLLAELYGRGAQKYEERNWERGYPWSLSFAALQRHIWQFWNGEDIDEETGIPHPVCAIFHCMALTEFLGSQRDYDNRPTKEPV